MSSIESVELHQNSAGIKEVDSGAVAKMLSDSHPIWFDPSGKSPDSTVGGLPKSEGCVTHVESEGTPSIKVDSIYQTGDKEPLATRTTVRGPSDYSSVIDFKVDNANYEARSGFLANPGLFQTGARGEGGLHSGNIRKVEQSNLSAQDLAAEKVLSSLRFDEVECNKSR